MGVRNNDGIAAAATRLLAGDVLAIKGLDGFHLCVDATNSDGWCRLAISAGDGQDVREPLAKLLHDNGWGVRELRREVASLEDFFVKVIAQQSEVLGK